MVSSNHIKSITVLIIYYHDHFIFSQVSPSIDEFAKTIEMTDVEKQRLASTLDALNTGQVSSLPPYITASASEGLSTLADQLIKTKFLDTDK